MLYSLPFPYLFVLPGNVAVVNNVTTQTAANVAIGSAVGAQTIAQVSTNAVAINQGLPFGFPVGK